MRFSSIEFKDLIKAWVAISIAFAILLSGLQNLFSFVRMFILSTLTVGIAFLLHELAHKFVAQHYGYFSEFRAFNQMLILAIIMSFFGFIIAAPGAVMIAGFVDREKGGKIALAGPLTNIALTILFLVPLILTGAEIARVGFMINSLLALFNLLPFGMFDGAKVRRWDKKVSTLFLIFAALLFFAQYII